MWPPSSYAPRDLSTTAMESGGTNLAAPTLSTPTITSEPLANAIDTSTLAERAMAPPPTYVTYQASFEPFTTDQYMFPEQDSWSLTDLERFQVDNLVFEDIKISESMYSPCLVTLTPYPGSTTPTYRVVSGGGSPSSSLASSTSGVSGLTGGSVTSEEVDARMNNLMTSMLYQFHYHILDTVSGVRFSVMDLLQSVRAVRDRLHPHSRGIRWDDEWP
ncbi:hypothetical protein CspHIS471_0604140 [Cutaneotrichosporon sp. HIS471]|nr:hypothetical protein CspHIS471_0604140 [Cutaneotrichosporon sp. HIS471]